jgi:hypothetical protein
MSLAGQLRALHQLQRGLWQVSLGPYINYKEVFGRSAWGPTSATERSLAGQLGALHQLQRGLWQVSLGPYTSTTERSLAEQLGALHQLRTGVWQISLGPYINFREVLIRSDVALHQILNYRYRSLAGCPGGHHQ